MKESERLFAEARLLGRSGSYGWILDNRLSKCRMFGGAARQRTPQSWLVSGLKRCRTSPRLDFFLMREAVEGSLTHAGGGGWSVASSSHCTRLRPAALAAYKAWSALRPSALASSAARRLATPMLTVM